MTSSRSARRRFTVDDLFQDTSARGEGVTDLEAAKEIRLDRIIPDPDQPRRTMDRARFEELVASIKQEGVLVPIEVSYDPERNIYVIVHGERRYRASKEAGRETIPALVRELDTRTRIVHQLMENILREDLNAVDRSRALRTLKEAMGSAPWEQVADAVGIRRSRLFQLLDVAKLPDEFQEDIRAGRLSEKHGRALKDLPPPQQAELRDLVLEEGLSGDETVRVGQLLRRGRPDLTAREALSTARAARTSRPAAPTSVEAPTVAPAPMRDADESPAHGELAEPPVARPSTSSGRTGDAGPASSGRAESTVPAGVQPASEGEAPAGVEPSPATTALPHPVAAVAPRDAEPEPSSVPGHTGEPVGAPSTAPVLRFPAPVMVAPVSPLSSLEEGQRTLVTLLGDLAGAMLNDAERAQAVALLGELQQAVAAALAQLRHQSSVVSPQLHLFEMYPGMEHETESNDDSEPRPLTTDNS